MSIDTLFLDRDGVINEVVMRNGVAASPRSISEFVIRSQFVEFYSNICHLKLNLFVVSNQPDISRQLLDETALAQMTDEIKAKFALTEICYCRHDNADQCRCRKPAAGMIVDLLERYSLDGKRALIIGDSWKDMQAGKAAGVKTALLVRPYNAMEDIASDYRVSNLSDLLPVLSPQKEKAQGESCRSK